MPFVEVGILIPLVLNEIRKHQSEINEDGSRMGNEGQNYLIGVLSGADGFRVLVQAVFREELILVGLINLPSLFERGDAVAILSELIQKHVTVFLEQLMLLAVKRTDTGVYPQVELEDLELMHDLRLLDDRHSAGKLCRVFCTHECEPFDQIIIEVQNNNQTALSKNSIDRLPSRSSSDEQRRL
jgi:hypothetical protein